MDKQLDVTNMVDKLIVVSKATSAVSDIAYVKISGKILKKKAHTFVFLHLQDPFLAD